MFGPMCKVFFKSERQGTFTLSRNSFTDLPILRFKKLIFDVNNQIQSRKHKSNGALPLRKTTEKLMKSPFWTVF